MRRWKCPSCETDNHRDENSAKNGLKKITHIVNEQGEYNSLVPCSGLVVQQRSVWRVMPRGTKILRGHNGRLHATAPKNLTNGTFMIPLTSS